MVHVTGNFQGESPLSPRTLAALNEALSQGWNDPLKLSQSAARSRILKSQCIESIANSLGVLPQEVEVLGEPRLANYWAIAGLLYPETVLVYSSIDRQEVHALARSVSKSQELRVDAAGQILLSHLPEGSVFALQAANGETGIAQDMEVLLLAAKGSAIACDFTSVGLRMKLPSRWNTAAFDAKAWQGPQGVGFLAIRENSGWHNPMPHINSMRTPGSYSLPLLIASVVALDEWKENEEKEREVIAGLTSEFRQIISTSVEDVDIAQGDSCSLPHITSLSFLYVEGEELLRELDRNGLSVDSGSACTSEDLQPSHVLSAMGLLTHGNVRLTFHQGTTREEMLFLATSIIAAVEKLRSR